MRARKRIAGVISIAAAGFLAAGLTVPANASSAAEDTAQFTQLVNLVTWESLKCAAIPGNNPANQVQVIQFTCGDVKHLEQQWEATDVDIDEFSNFVYVFKNKRTLKCLTAAGGGIVWQYTCIAGNKNQRWAYDRGWRLHNQESGKCLAVPGGPRDDTVGLIHFTCSDSKSQKWDKVPV
ncbi:hypothetical protein GCM10009554_54910 [Kribbella koreensis]|uniref:Ricin B lectin domain-containing protein n=1 Tax=Kribbella koreensis TaxID=57909 RepID=A0ABN1R5K6_9ACTN